MKTLSDMTDWILGAAARYGDPAERVAPIYARYVPRPTANAAGDILAAWKDDKLWISITDEDWIDLPIDADGPQFDLATGELKAFGLVEICAGFWTLSPSLNVPGQFHFFVHVFDVPAIAPWERRIIAVSSFG